MSYSVIREMKRKKKFLSSEYGLILLLMLGWCYNHKEDFKANL
jgi:hypothetical protein